MNHDREDIEFRNKLKSGVRQASEDPWFVKKVVNKLPNQHQGKARWMEAGQTVLCVVLVFACWAIYYNTGDFGEVTQEDILKFLGMFAGSLYLVYLAIGPLIFEENKRGR